VKAVRIQDYRPVFFGWPKYYNEDEGDLSMVVTGVFFGQPAWSDGHILMLGPPPHDPTREMLPFTKIEGRCESGVLRKICPFGIVEDGPYTALIFDDNSRVQAKYYNLVIEKWPDAEFFGSGHDQQITARSQGVPVAALMPLRPHGNIDVYRNAIEASGAEEPSAAGLLQCPAKTEESITQ